MTVKRSLIYLKLMEQAGLTDPFRELHDKPEKAARWVKRKKESDKNVSS